MLGIFTLSMFIPFTIASVNLIYISHKNNMSGYKLPSIMDFQLSFIFMLVFLVLEMFFKNALYVLFIPICKVQDN
jgi:hypothetical protein